MTVRSVKRLLTVRHTTTAFVRQQHAGTLRRESSLRSCELSSVASPKSFWWGRNV